VRSGSPNRAGNSSQLILSILRTNMPSDIVALQMKIISLRRQIICTITRIEWARTGLSEVNDPAELPNNLLQPSDEDRSKKLRMEQIMRRLPDHLLSLGTRLREAIRLFEKKRKVDRRNGRLRRFLGSLFCSPTGGANQKRGPISQGQALLDRDIYAHFSLRLRSLRLSSGGDRRLQFLGRLGLLLGQRINTRC